MHVVKVDQYNLSVELSHEDCQQLAEACDLAADGEDIATYQALSAAFAMAAKAIEGADHQGIREARAAIKLEGKEEVAAS